jgi:hypothetical protein
LKGNKERGREERYTNEGKDRKIHTEIKREGRKINLRERERGDTKKE